MMRIIKEGFIPKYHAECPQCGCEFEFDELEAEDNVSPDEIPYTIKFVRCPCCCNRIHKNLWKKEKDAR